MYIQTIDGFFVSNPSYNSLRSDCEPSYYTKDDQIILFVTNKKEAPKVAKEWFSAFELVFDRKIGPFNCFIVNLKGPLLVYDTQVTCSYPPPLEPCLFWSLDCNKDELSKRSHRGKLLADWVLKGANPTQFNKLLQANFDVVHLSGDTVRVTPKIPAKEGTNDRSHPSDIS